MGKDIEIRIAFKGQAKALKQFRNMLVPAGSAGSANTTTTTTTNASGDDPKTTTITTIKEATPSDELGETKDDEAGELAVPGTGLGIGSGISDGETIPKNASNVSDAEGGGSVVGGGGLGSNKTGADISDSYSSAGGVDSAVLGEEGIGANEPMDGERNGLAATNGGGIEDAGEDAEAVARGVAAALSPVSGASAAHDGYEQETKRDIPQHLEGIDERTSVSSRVS